jgi:hypothetical protein
VAKEIAVLVSCDVCSARRQDGANIQEDVPVEVGKQEREVDLCADCRAQLDEHFEVYLQAGRKPNSLNGAVAPAGSVKYSEYDLTKCPVPDCGATYADSKGTRRHLREQHSLGLREALLAYPVTSRKGPDFVEPEPDMPCPECAEAGDPRSFHKAQGLAAHRSRVHGVAGTAKSTQKNAARTQRRAAARGAKKAPPRKTTTRRAG